MLVYLQSTCMHTHCFDDHCPGKHDLAGCSFFSFCFQRAAYTMLHLCQFILSHSMHVLMCFCEKWLFLLWYVVVCGRGICTWCRPVGTRMAISCLFRRLWRWSGGVIWASYSKENYRCVSIVSGDVVNLNLN